MLTAKLMQPSSAALARTVYYPSPQRKVLISADVAEPQVTTADTYFSLTIATKVQAATPKKAEIRYVLDYIYAYFQ